MTKQFASSLPAKFINNVTGLCGAKGALWLEELPAVIASLESEWSISAGANFPALSYNYVAPATTAAGDAAVLKIGLPTEDTEIFGESKYLSILDGCGCPCRISESRERRAILIERVTPGRTLREQFAGREDDALPVLIRMIDRTTASIPDDTADLIKLDDWFDGLLRAVGTSFSKRHTERAFRYYSEMSESAPNRLLHGDLHHENILTATREPYLAIDPKAIIGPIGYEIAVFLNNHLWWMEWKPDAAASLGRAVDMYAEAFAMSSRDIRQWAFCQMVLGTWWSFDEMNEDFSEGLGFADMWNV
ncbi:MAG: aminoglycoside phosphotransferase family protein [Pyrinomonadaceae bacterium]